MSERFGKRWDEFNKKGIEAAMEAIRGRIRETSIEVSKEIPYCPLETENIRVETGSPVKSIVSMAEDGNYDLVIMGTHGYGKLESSIIGSVANGVISQCSKPVLVVHLPNEN